MKKLSDVVMLPTEKASHIYLNIKTNSLGYVSGKYPEDLEQFPQKDIVTQNQHLYFLSDDEIEGGDYALSISNKEVFKVTKVEKGVGTFNNIYCNNVCYYLSSNDIKKIIATTDESLLFTNSIPHPRGGNSKQLVATLPKPSNEFLKKFCEVGGIWKVLVEYESRIFIPDGTLYDLKVAPDNTITIYPIES